MDKIRLITIPNLITLGNLLCGSAAAAAALVCHDLGAAFWFVAAAAVCDFFDGFAARLLGSYSPLGVQLDSLADMVSFGFAPSALLYALALPAATAAGIPWAAFGVFVLAACSALRLAKFNIDESQTTEFCGLPTPAAAIFCASAGMLAARGALPELSLAAVLATALVLALLLVSPVRMFSLKFHGFGWSENRLRYLFLIACAVLLAALRWFAPPVIIILYAAVSTLRWVAMRGNAGNN